MATSNRVFNALYHRYISGVAQIYTDRRLAGYTCQAALEAARDYSEKKGAGR